MEPITTAIALGTAAYNMYAGYETSKYQEGVLNKKKSLDNRMRQFKMDQVDQSFLTGLTNIQKSSSNTLAGLAQSGNIGAGAQAVANAQVNESTTKLEDWKSNALKEIAFSKEASDMNFETALDELNAQSQSKMTNSFLDIAGAGTSLIGSAVDAGTFDFMFKTPSQFNLDDQFSGKIDYGSNDGQVARSKYRNQGFKVAQ